MDFQFYEILEESVAEITIGSFDFYRGLLAGSADLGPGRVLTGAFETTTYSGPWNLDEDLAQYKLFTSYAMDAGNGPTQVHLSGLRQHLGCD